MRGSLTWSLRYLAREPELETQSQHTTQSVIDGSDGSTSHEVIPAEMTTDRKRFEHRQREIQCDPVPDCLDARPSLTQIRRRHLRLLHHSLLHEQLQEANHKHQHPPVTYRQALHECDGVFGRFGGGEGIVVQRGRDEWVGELAEEELEEGRGDVRVVDPVLGCQRAGKETGPEQARGTWTGRGGSRRSERSDVAAHSEVWSQQGCLRMVLGGSRGCTANVGLRTAPT